MIVRIQARARNVVGWWSVVEADFVAEGKRSLQIQRIKNRCLSYLRRVDGLAIFATPLLVPDVFFRRPICRMTGMIPNTAVIPERRLANEMIQLLVRSVQKMVHHVVNRFFCR
ncbi:hypothetical protein [Rhizobium leguminosarum]|nr:hypothetical protein [Rhizobium leguminosarum]TBZ50710.1 hypothetical protein E0H42_20940 [Rhizobium leguminosarum bv. viciae]